MSCCWYKWKRVSKVLVIVEDQMSAIKVAGTYHSLALLGTNLSDAKVEEIRQQDKYDRIMLCLDADAVGHGIRLMLQLRDKLPNLQVFGLKQDIKDMDDIAFDSFMLGLI